MLKIKDDVDLKELEKFGFVQHSIGHQIKYELKKKIGNHDEIFLKDKKFDKSLFEEIAIYKQVKYNKKVFVLFHYPIAEHDGKMNGYIHLYGHIHSMNLELEKELGELCHNVGVDRNHYTPVNIEKYIGGTNE